MSDLPVALHGERITAVVVGGGSVGTRKALALVETGAQVRVVAPDVSQELEAAERAREVTISPRIVQRRPPRPVDARRCRDELA